MSQNQSYTPTINSSDGLTSSSFEKTVVDWLTGSFQGKCHRSLQDPLPAEEYIDRIKNSVT